jgi:hypothetical protein
MGRKPGFRSCPAARVYRSAEQDPKRRFHALDDELACSDVLWGAWVDVATNHGAPGVDGVSIEVIEAGGVESVRTFPRCAGRAAAFR